MSRRQTAAHVETRTWQALRQSPAKSACRMASRRATVALMAASSAFTSQRHLWIVSSDSSNASCNNELREAMETRRWWARKERRRGWRGWTALFYEGSLANKEIALAIRKLVVLVLCFTCLVDHTPSPATQHDTDTDTDTDMGKGKGTDTRRNPLVLCRCP